jgi:hypothetical protein
MRRFLTLVFIAACSLLPVLGQGEIDDQVHVLFRDESTFGVFLNSDGFGLNYRYGFYRNVRNQLLLDIDLSYVKHPKEVKTQVAYDYSTRRYVYGKENLFWELKGVVGWQKELYRKYDRNGISVRWFYGGGISLGFIKPIYYEVFDWPVEGEEITWEYKKFDTHFDQAQIGGRGPFFMGFDELSLAVGLTGRSGLSFEYSRKDVMLHALEAGVGLTAYPKEIPIMGTDVENNFLFFNLSVGYRFGRIKDISEAARAKSWKKKRQERKAQESTIPYTDY